MKRKFMIAAVYLTCVLGMGTTAYAKPELMPDNTLFDAEYYAQVNPDVASALGTDINALYQHYLMYGKSEGRAAVSPENDLTDLTVPNEEFDATFYAYANPDVVAALGTNADVLYQHYIQYGKAEGRLGKVPTAQKNGGIVSENSYARQVLDIVNRERAAVGLSALSWSDELANAANIRAKEMVILCEHTRPNGTSCFTVFDECGIKYRCAGENIAWGQTTPEEVMEDWMNSPEHRANILKGDYGKLGVSYLVTENGWRYWAQLFTD